MCQPRANHTMLILGRGEVARDGLPWRSQGRHWPPQPCDDFQLSWTWRSQPVGPKREKRDVSGQITWQGWTHCLPWMKLICLAPCCLQTPSPKQSVPVLPLHQPLWCPCLLLFTSFTLFSQPGKKRSQSPCHSARWNLEVAQDMSECSNYMSVILTWLYRKQLTAVMEILLKKPRTVCQLF